MALTKIDDRGLKTPIDLLDNEKIRLGTGNDLEIYHAGAHTKLVNKTGQLRLQSADFRVRDYTNDHEMIIATEDGSVELYYDNVKKFETTSSGAKVTGSLNTTSYIYIDNGEDLWLEDNGKIRIGNGDDLKIYHNGSYNFITGDSTGKNLYLRAKENEEGICVENNGPTYLAYDGSYKFQTTTEGAQVKIATANTRLRVHSDTDSSPVAGIELMRGTNDTFGADAYTDWSILNSGANLVFSSANNGSTHARVTVDYEGDLWVGVTPTTHHNNRTAFFHDASDNFVSITSGSGATAGIVFGDSVANTTANYESYIAHYNVNDSLYLYTDQGSKGLELKKAGDVSVIDGNLDLAAGHGINFGANSHASGATSELLDDYEEGEFNPAVQGSTSAGTGSNSAIEGHYTKIGNLVHIDIYINQTSHDGTGDIRITTPFTCKTNAQVVGSVLFDNVDFDSNFRTIASHIWGGSSLLAFYGTKDDASWGAIPMSGNLDSSVRYILSLTYPVA
jgi:hypothetical protein